MNKKEILKLAKGFRGRAKNCIRIARERVEKALQYSYRDRRNKKRDMRSLWIQRINAGTRQHGVISLFLPLAVLNLKFLFAYLHCFLNSWGCTRPDRPPVPGLIAGFFFSWHVNYGNFMHGLMKENIQLNRKVLSEISMHEPYSFKALVDISRNAFPGNKNVVLPTRKADISINV
ncbi:hypothetical protein Gotri_019877 [Gossypium trilobum]|uniref:Large ribosomal subunit protein bL20c n=5 Tax=Gossypium TaxID=3633 RepID=A0A7J9EEE4_9ROSI|nr:hypothetical protein [Gossypium trilobum]